MISVIIFHLDLKNTHPICALHHCPPPTPIACIVLIGIFTQDRKI